MEDLSLHILDIAENAVNAGATSIEILVRESLGDDFLLIEITDNGRGMDSETVEKALDPFYTTRTTRRVGLGLPFLREAATAANGDVTVRSSPGRGTTVTARFQRSHIDRKPFGDIAETVATIIAGWPEVDLSYSRQRDHLTVSFTTKDIRPYLEGRPMNSPPVLKFIREHVRQFEMSLFDQ